MTLKEMMMKHRPNLVGPNHWGGVASCPSNYDFLPRNMNLCKKGCVSATREHCEQCWNQEIPKTVFERFNEALLCANENLRAEINILRKTLACEMTANEYQQMALRTEPESLTRDDCPLSVRLTHGLMGLNGEAGEAIDILKKHIFQGHDLDKEHLAKELGDVAWYLAVTANALGYSLEDIFEMNIEKLKARYPEGFDSDKSVNRAEDDI